MRVQNGGEGRTNKQRLLYQSCLEILPNWMYFKKLGGESSSGSNSLSHTVQYYAALQFLCRAADTFLRKIMLF